MRKESAHVGIILCAKTLRNWNGKTVAYAHAKANDHKRNGAGISDPCQCLDSQKPSDNQRIHHAVQLLKQHSAKKRQCKPKNQPHRFSDRQVLYPTGRRRSA